MPLTIPNSFKTKNLLQNWLFQLFYDDESASDYIGLSFSSATVSSIRYHGVVINSPSIRESINLETSKAKTGNLSLTVANFDYLGAKFSKELFSTRKYINRQIKVFIQPNNASVIGDCLQIYTGKLDTVSHDERTVKMSIKAKTPWDGVEVPQVKSLKNNYYPIAYGDYTPNSNSVSFSTSAGDDEYNTRKTLYPIPVNEIRGSNVFALTGINSISSNAQPHFYEKELDKFLPLGDDSSDVSSIDSANEVYVDGYAVRFHKNLIKRTLLKPTERISSDTGWQSNNNAFNGSTIDTSSSTNFTLDSFNFTDGTTRDIKFSTPQLTGVPTLFAVSFLVEGTCTFAATSGTGEIRIQLINNTFGNEDVAGYFAFTNSSGIVTTTNMVKSATGNSTNISSPATMFSNESLVNNFVSSGSGWGEDLVVRIKLKQQSGNLDGTITMTLKLFDIAVQVGTKLDYSVTTTSGKSVASQTLADIDFVYSGGDGLTDNGWNSNSAITEIHEAHRDLLHRFTSYTNSNTPTNWGSGLNINSIKDWKIRYWINEPVLLIKVLEKLQYEGGFIFRFDGQGNGVYIFVPDSITTNHTLSKSDINNLKISLSPMNKIVSRMDIELEKHPAISGYMTTVNASNSTAISDLNIGANENKRTIRLDALVSSPATSPSSNPNDDFYTYYDNISGSQKLLVSCDVVNPEYFGIDVGDFVAFTDMPYEPFGTTWSGKNFIVTDVTRQVSKLKVKFREV